MDVFLKSNFIADILPTVILIKKEIAVSNTILILWK